MGTIPEIGFDGGYYYITIDGNTVHFDSLDYLREAIEANPYDQFLISDGELKSFQITYIQRILQDKLNKSSSKPDMVNHPPHYTNHPSGVECIQITRHMSFNLGNAVKYIWRADLKGQSIEDLKKAVFYINDEIKLRESK